MIKINNIIQGTGFLIDYDEIGKGLMTCYHVINFQTLQNKERIKFYFGVQSKELDIDYEKRSRCIFAEPDLDITFIELFEEDFNFEIYFLKYSLIDDYKNQQIFILQYPGGNDISYGEGKILSLNTVNNRKNLIHDISTLPGCSGSPLILKYNDYRVIGIHKSGDKKNKINYSTLINTELIKKIKDLIGFYYTYEYTFFAIEKEKKRRNSRDI